MIRCVGGCDNVNSFGTSEAQTIFIRAASPSEASDDSIDLLHDKLRQVLHRSSTMTNSKDKIGRCVSDPAKSSLLANIGRSYVECTRYLI